MAAADLDGDYHFDDLPVERVGRYWKNAARMYHLACTSDAVETKDLYLQVAMAWAALASELEATPVPALQDGDRDRPAH
jgi:hypothetical protein